MHIRDFDWDDGNIVHLALGHGIEPEEAKKYLHWRRYSERRDWGITRRSARRNRVVFL